MIADLRRGCAERDGGADLAATLVRLLHHVKMVGLNIGIYDPDLDPTGTYAEEIAVMLRRWLAVYSEQAVSSFR